MLIASIVREGNNSPKLVIQPEVTDGGEEVEIPVSEEMVLKLEQLEELSNERE